jgi:ribosomal protein S11
MAAEEAMKKAVSLGIDQIDLIQKTGTGRESAIRASRQWFEVTSIEDIPHTSPWLPVRQRNDAYG